MFWGFATGVDSDVIIVESSSERCGTHAPLPVIRRGMKNEALYVDCFHVFFFFYEDEDIVGGVIKLEKVLVVVVVVAGTRRASKNRFLKTGGGAKRRVQQSFGGVFNGSWARE